MNCLLCSSKNLRYDELSVDVSVSSDNKFLNKKCRFALCNDCGFVQKIVDDEYLKSLNSLYSEYSSYVLTSGKDQIKDFDKIPATRSSLIIELVKNYLPEDGKFLDIGTGSGVFLKEFSKHFPKFKVYAHDIVADPNFDADTEKIYIGDVEQIDEKFDVISLIHVLEHVYNVQEFIINLKKILNDDGVLLIQVPDSYVNYFDYAVYDHMMHFTKCHLYELFIKQFRSVVFPEKQIGKEITVLVSNNINLPTTKKPDFCHINNLNSFKSFIDSVKSLEGDLGVFGTTPVSTFFSGLVAEKLACSLDEDKSKLNKQHMGAPILNPAEYTFDYKVILPFPKFQAENIIKKFNKISFFTNNI